jgi:hypothetical protein
LDGKSYFYNNPLTCRGDLTRAPWYSIPCCPSNLSRTWASLSETAFSIDEGRVYVNQYIPGTHSLNAECQLNLSSRLPWNGDVTLTIHSQQVAPIDLFFRLPAWASGWTALLNGEVLSLEDPGVPDISLASAVGLHFERARYLRICREFHTDDRIDLNFSMPLSLRQQDERIPRCAGMTALTCGPVVYCLESIDNPAGIFDLVVEPDSLESRYETDLLGGCVVYNGQTTGGQAVKFIPYMLWGNRGRSQMTVFFREAA